MNQTINAWSVNIFDLESKVHPLYELKTNAEKGMCILKSGLLGLGGTGSSLDGAAAVICPGMKIRLA